VTTSILDHDSTIEIARARHLHLYIQFGLAPDVTAHLRVRLAEQVEHHDNKSAPPGYGVDNWKRRRKQTIAFYESVIRRATSQVHRYDNWSPTEADRDLLITHLATKHEEAGFAFPQKTYSMRKAEEFWHRDHLVSRFTSQKNPETGRDYDQVSAALQAAKEILKLKKDGDLHYATKHNDPNKLAPILETAYSARNAPRKRMKKAAKDLFEATKAQRAEMEARHEQERSLISTELKQQAEDTQRKISGIRSTCAMEWAPRFAEIDARYRDTLVREIGQLRKKQEDQLKRVPDMESFTHRRKRMADRHSNGLLRLRSRIASQYQEELAGCRLDMAASQMQATADIHIPKAVQEYWDQRNQRNAERAAVEKTENSAFAKTEKMQTAYESELFPPTLREWLRYRDHVLDRTPGW